MRRRPSGFELVSSGLLVVTALLVVLVAYAPSGRSAESDVEPIGAVLDFTRADQQIAGYADVYSILPGGTATLRVRSDASWDAVAYRIGSRGGDASESVWRTSVFAPVRQPAPTVRPSTRTVEAAWEPTLAVPTDGWRPGFYLIRLRQPGTHVGTLVPLVVRTADPSGRSLVSVAVATWAAYNHWGGYSAYSGPDGALASRSYEVSLDRPLDAKGLSVVLAYEYPAATFIDRVLPDAAWTTWLDVALGRTSLTRVRQYVSTGHDEYWPVAQRRAVEAARDRGTNLFFMGANAVYWRIRLADGPAGPDRHLVVYKDGALDPQKDSASTSAKFRDAPRPQPETELMGVMFTCYPSTGDFVVRDPEFWAFAGTGVTQGTRFAHLASRETDQVVPGSPVPARTRIVAHSRVTCPGGIPTPLVGRRELKHDMVYSTARSGSGTIATGTMLWVCALAGCEQDHVDARASEFVRRTTATILTRFDRGPAANTEELAAVWNLGDYYRGWSRDRTGGGTRRLSRVI